MLSEQTSSKDSHIINTSFDKHTPAIIASFDKDSTARSDKHNTPPTIASFDKHNIPATHEFATALQVLSEQIISNESRIAKTKVIVNFNKPRQMQFTFLVRYEDFSKVEAICTDMKDHLLNTEGIHRQLPMWVGFVGVEHGACNIYTIVSRVILLVVTEGICSDIENPI